MSPDLRTVNRLLRDLKDIAASESRPQLMLNDHCQTCEFRRGCLAQAVQEDNLSLLRGMGPKEIKGKRKRTQLFDFPSSFFFEIYPVPFDFLGGRGANA